MRREAGADLDEDGGLIVARTVSAGGRSRAHVGGRSVPIGLLAELAEELAAVHGQSDQHLLRRPGRQREALDRFAGAPAARDRRRRTSRRTSGGGRSRRRCVGSPVRRGSARSEPISCGSGSTRSRRSHRRRARTRRSPPRPTGSPTPTRCGPARSGPARCWPGTTPSAPQAWSGCLAEARARWSTCASLDRGLDPLAERVAGLGYEAADVVGELGVVRGRRSTTTPPGSPRCRSGWPRSARLTRKYGSDLDAVLDVGRGRGQGVGDPRGRRRVDRRARPTSAVYCSPSACRAGRDADPASAEAAQRGSRQR